MSREQMDDLNKARAARPGYNSGGRPREITLIGEDFKHYDYLRKTMGAAFAREAFGIGAGE